MICLGTKEVGKGRRGPDCEGLTVIILYAIVYLIIDLLCQVSVFISQNTEIVALKSDEVS